MTKAKPRDPLPPLKFTSFHVPGQINTKNVTSNYLKSDTQTIWARKAIAVERKKQSTDAAPEEQLEGPSGSKTIVIHPGSRTLRIGRASDYSPAQVPAVVARKKRASTSSTPGPNGAANGNGQSYVGKGKGREVPLEMPARASGDDGMDVDAPAMTPNEEMTNMIHSLRAMLNYRTNALNLRTMPQAVGMVKEYNEEVRSETVEDFNDPLRIEWDSKGASGDLVFGKDVSKLDFAAGIYEARYPWLEGELNDVDYSSFHGALQDAEALIRHIISIELSIPIKDLASYSVVYVIPDHVSRRYIEEVARLLLVDLGFKQLCFQQESMGAAFGAGVSTACVVDLGAKKTAICCVEDGMVIHDSRIVLSYGGDDVTTFLASLLRHSAFPYQQLDLTKSYDWAVIQTLKERFCTLSEAQVGLNTHHFMVRRPGEKTQKFALKTFDEVILGPMMLFEPRVVDFEAKRRTGRWRTGLVEDGQDYTLDTSTSAMNMSTWHLRPAPTPVALTDDASVPSATPVDALAPAQNSIQAAPPASSPLGTPAPLPSTSAGGTGPSAATPPADADPGFDIVEEAGKVPLDVALCNAIIATGNEDRIRKMSGSLLLVGGTASIPAIGYAIQSRLLPLLNSRFPSVQTISIVPPPREIDPALLVWKGVSVFARMECAADFWVGGEEWATFGMRALRDRSLFL